MGKVEYKAWNEKYEVGSDGTVWSLDYNHTGQRKILKTYLDQDGYPYVFLNNEGVRRKEMVHRMVAKLFLKQPSEKHQVNHINGVRNDNRLVNLEWVTARENVIHSFKVNGRQPSEKLIAHAKKCFKGIKNPKCKLTPKEVCEIRHLRNDQRLSLLEIATKYNISRSQVSAIAIGRSWNEEI